MRFSILLVILFIGYLSASAQSTETRNVSAFEGVEVSGKLATTLRRGPHRVVVSGKPADLERLETRVENGRLRVYLRPDKSWGGSWKRMGKVEVAITAPDLDYIGFNGSGSLKTMDRFNAEKLTIDMNGSGDMEVAAEARELHIGQNGSGSLRVSGDAQRVRVKKNGSGSLDAPRLSAATVQVKANGSGLSRLHAANELEVEINGSGSLTYSGNPRLRTDINGSARVYQADRQ